MTEAEAKTKWCPMVRCDGKNRHWGANQVAAPMSCCVASACMAWRPVGNDKFRDNRTGELSDRDTTGNGQWVKTGGYCGLAGAPQ